MENPWKKKSRISPQAENGHRRVENTVWQHLMKQRLSGLEWDVVAAVIDKTYGYGKVEDRISYSCIAGMTGRDRRDVIRGIQRLQMRRIVVVGNSPLGKGKGINIILFNKYWDTWVEPEKTIREVVGYSTPGSGISTTRTSGKFDTHKRKKKRYKRKKISAPVEDAFWTEKRKKDFNGWADQLKQRNGGFNAYMFLLAMKKEGQRDEDVFEVIQYVASPEIEIEDIWPYCMAAVRSKKQRWESAQVFGNLLRHIKENEELKKEERDFIGGMKRGEEGKP